MSTDKLAQLILSIVIVVGFGISCIVLVMWPPANVSSLASAAAGALATAYIQVISFWFNKPKDPTP